MQQAEGGQSIVFVMLLLVAALWLALLGYCVVPRMRQWKNPTSCRCGYDVESIVGTDAASTSFQASMHCPECGTPLTLEHTRIRGQVEAIYAPKTVSIVVVGVTWIMLAVVLLVCTFSLAPSDVVLRTWITSKHAVGTKEVTITWRTEKVVVLPAANAGTGAVMEVDIPDGRMFTVTLPRDELADELGWDKWQLRDDAGNEVWMAQRDMPDELTAWLQRSTSLTDPADVAMLTTVVREGVYGLQRIGEPGLYNATWPPTIHRESAKREYSSATYVVLAFLAGLWLLGAVRSMRVIAKRRPHAPTSAQSNPIT
jgi:hypothetical protein